MISHTHKGIPCVRLISILIILVVPLHDHTHKGIYCVRLISILIILVVPLHYHTHKRIPCVSIFSQDHHRTLPRNSYSTRSV